MKTITFGGGCFWCIEAIFAAIKGVITVKVGYAGGHVSNPTYEAICEGNTGHAEVIQIEFDENLVSLETLITVFFDTHDPTTLNRQGADVGTQYRSVIFYTDDGQKSIAERIIKELTDNRIFTTPIVTEVVELTNYFQAEDYHQNYFNNNKNQGYCRMVINPKLNNFMAKHTKILK